MRLFIAILFDQKIMNSLSIIVDRLKSEAKSGTFTRKENLHLTLNFIGETKRVNEVQEAMKTAIDKTNTKSFPLNMEGFGKFNRREGDIYWMGVNAEIALVKLQKALVKELKEAGFYEIDDKEYKPHLTLGRRIRVMENFSPKDFEASMVKLQMMVQGISLMSSERVDGKLVYKEIYQVDLK